MKFISGFNLKDLVSNLGGIAILIGSTITIAIKTDFLPSRWQKYADGSIGIGGAIVAYATGKSANLQGGQSDSENN